MNKADFIKQIRKLIGNGLIDDALNLLLQKIRQLDYSLATDVLMLSSWYNAAKNNFIVKGISEQSHYDTLFANISYAVLTLLNNIEEKSAYSKRGNAGRLLHKIPSRMCLFNESTICKPQPSNKS